MSYCQCCPCGWPQRIRNLAYCRIEGNIYHFSPNQECREVDFPEVSALYGNTGVYGWRWDQATGGTLLISNFFTVQLLCSNGVYKVIASAGSNFNQWWQTEMTITSFSLDPLYVFATATEPLCGNLFSVEIYQ